MDNTKKNKQKSDYKLRKRAELRLKVLEYLITHPCITCGEKDPIVLEFDHVDRGDKILSIARMVNNCADWSTVEKEIGKCNVLCANCHRRRTHKQLGFWKQL